MSDNDKRPLGYVQDPQDLRDHPVDIYLLESTIELPESVQLDHPSPIRDQGRLGSCVGFACAALKEWQEVKQRPGTPFTDVSEAWIYWKSKEIDPWGIWEEGTSFRYALKVLQKSGAPTESCWKYKDINSSEGRGTPRFYAPLVAWWGRIGNYARITTLHRMKETLHLKGPFLLGIKCFNGIYNPVNGVIDLPKRGENSIGGHAILVTGYDDSKSMFTIRNSWGENWGDKGYGYLSYTYIERHALDAWVAVDK